MCLISSIYRQDIKSDRRIALTVLLCITFIHIFIGRSSHSILIVCTTFMFLQQYSVYCCNIERVKRIMEFLDANINYKNKLRKISICEHRKAGFDHTDILCTSIMSFRSCIQVFVFEEKIQASKKVFLRFINTANVYIYIHFFIWMLIH